MATDSPDAQTATPGQVAVWPETVSDLAEQIGVTVKGRTKVRVWSMSGVERLDLVDGRTVILKYAVQRFGEEPAILRHAAEHGVPVPKVLASKVQPDGSAAFFLEDLGDRVREATLQDAAQAAAAIHRCPPMDGIPVLDQAALAALPTSSLATLDHLQAAGRWKEADTNGIRATLQRLQRVAEQRAADADLPPFGLCHSEFHPTSLHVTNRGPFLLDLARAFTGPGLLDLVSWQGTVDPLDLGKVTELLDAYVAAGGPEEATADRGGLPAHRWASGWFKMWIAEWFMESTLKYALTTDSDAPNQRGVLRDLREAAECLVDA
ncbi:phosphotransferase [Actinomadura nitritigenes]|uniref:phosphotransferase n=1 Tax=Actinomadura nitritigenes TaxID=134602 RepID=UPI003D918C58